MKLRELRQLIREEIHNVTTETAVNKPNNNIVNTLYNKIISYMDNNYNDFDIVEDDVYTILHDNILSKNPSLKKQYVDSMFSQILNKIKKESEYNLVG
jgi:hypothetical protein